MASPKQKVKQRAWSEVKRYRVTLEKTVTLRLVTTMEVDAERIDAPKAVTQRAIHRAARAKLDAERAAGTEREWSTNFIDGNCDFSIDWGSVQEIEPHIEDTAAKTDV